MTTKQQKLSFEEWMKKVDDTLTLRVGMTSDDLEDYCYRDAYDDGDSPSRTASAVIRSNGGDY